MAGEQRRRRADEAPCDDARSVRRKLEDGEGDRIVAAHDERSLAVARGQEGFETSVVRQRARRRSLRSDAPQRRDEHLGSASGSGEEADRSSLGSYDSGPLRSAGSGGDWIAPSGALAPGAGRADPGDERLARRLSVANRGAQSVGVAGKDEGAGPSRIEAPSRRPREQIGTEQRDRFPRQLVRSERPRLRSSRLEELVQAVDAARAVEEHGRLGARGHQRRPSRGERGAYLRALGLSAHSAKLHRDSFMKSIVSSLEPLEARIAPATFVVTNNGDSAAPTVHPECVARNDQMAFAAGLMASPYQTAANTVAQRAKAKTLASRKKMTPRLLGIGSTYDFSGTSTLRWGPRLRRGPFRRQAGFAGGQC